MYKRRILVDFMKKIEKSNKQIIIFSNKQLYKELGHCK